MATSAGMDEYSRWSREMEIRTRTIRSIDDIIDGLKIMGSEQQIDNNNDTQPGDCDEGADGSKQSTSPDYLRPQSGRRNQLRNQHPKSELMNNDVIFENVSSDTKNKNKKNRHRSTVVNSSDNRSPTTSSWARQEEKPSRRYSSKSCFRGQETESADVSDGVIRRLSRSGYNPTTSGVGSGIDDQQSSDVAVKDDTDMERRSRKSRSFWSAFGCGGGKSSRSRGKSADDSRQSSLVKTPSTSAPLTFSYRSSPLSVSRFSRSLSAQPQVRRSSEMAVQTEDCLHLRVSESISGISDRVDSVTSDVTTSIDNSRIPEDSRQQDFTSSRMTDIDDICTGVVTLIVDDNCGSPEVTCQLQESVLDDEHKELDVSLMSSLTPSDGVSEERDLWRLNGRRLADIVFGLLRQEPTATSGSPPHDEGDVVELQCSSSYTAKTPTATAENNPSTSDCCKSLGDEHLVNTLSSASEACAFHADRDQSSTQHSDTKTSSAEKLTPSSSYVVDPLFNVVSPGDVTTVRQRQPITFEPPFQRGTAARHSSDDVKCRNFSEHPPAMTSSTFDFRRTRVNGSAVGAEDLSAGRQPHHVENHRNNVVDVPYSGISATGTETNLKRVDATEKTSDSYNQQVDSTAGQRDGSQQTSTSADGGTRSPAVRRQGADRAKHTGMAHRSFDERFASMAARELSVWRQMGDNEPVARPPRPVSSSQAIPSRRSTRAQSPDSARHLIGSNDELSWRRSVQIGRQVSPNPIDPVPRRFAVRKGGQSQSVVETGNEQPTQSRWVRCSRSAERTDRSRNAARRSPTSSSPCSVIGGDKTSTPGRGSADSFRSPIRRRSLSREWTVVVVTTEEEITVVQTPTPTPQRSPSPPTPASMSVTSQSAVLTDQSDVGQTTAYIKAVPIDLDLDSGRDVFVVQDVFPSLDRSHSVEHPSISGSILAQTGDGDWNCIADTLSDMVDHLDGCAGDVSDVQTTMMNATSSDEMAFGTIFGNSDERLLGDKSCISEYSDGGFEYSRASSKQVDVDSFDDLIASLLNFADNEFDSQTDNVNLNTRKEATAGKSSKTDGRPGREDVTNNKHSSSNRHTQIKTLDLEQKTSALPRQRHVSDDFSSVIPVYDTVDYTTVGNEGTRNIHGMRRNVGTDSTSLNINDNEIILVDNAQPISLELFENADLRNSLFIDDDCVDADWTGDNFNETQSGDSEQFRNPETESADSILFDELIRSCDETINRLSRDLTEENSCSTSCAGSSSNGIRASAREDSKRQEVCDDDTVEGGDDDVWNSAMELPLMTAKSSSVVHEDLGSDVIDRRRARDTTSVTSATVDQRMADDVTVSQRHSASDMDIFIEKAFIESLVGSIGTIIFLLAAALIFHVLNRFVEHEFGR